MNNRTGSSILWTGLTIGFLFFGYPFCVHAASPFNCNGELYKDLSFSQPEKNFSILDKVYFNVTCTELPAGSYTIVTEWTNPMGKLTRQDNHVFEIKETTGYMAHSWMKLLRKGPLQRNFTGQDVDIEHYGEWAVKAYLHGKEVAEKKFTFH
jgi:hypothetical protein